MILHSNFEPAYGQAESSIALGLPGLVVQFLGLECGALVLSLG